MRCKLFTEKIDSFISGEMPEEFKTEMKIHMLSCEECRRLYEDELFIEKAFEESLNMDDIVFKSQKDKIMASIDKNKYNNVHTKEHRVHKSWIKVGAPIAAAITFIVLINPSSKFKVLDKAATNKVIEEVKSQAENSDMSSSNNAASSKENSIAGNDDSISYKVEDSQSNNASNMSEESSNSILDHDIEKEVAFIDDTRTADEDNRNQEEVKGNSSDNNIIEEENKDIVIVDKESEEPKNIGNENNNQGVEESVVEKIEDSKKEIIPSFAKAGITLRVPLSFSKKMVNSSIQHELLNSWEQSLDKKYNFYLSNKEANTVRKLYIQDLYSKNMWCLELTFPYREVYPKYVKWDSNSNVFVVFEEIINETTYREELYTVNVETGEGFMIYKVLDDNKSIVDVTRDNNNVKLKIDNNKYDNINKSYEEYTINNTRSGI